MHRIGKEATFNSTVDRSETFERAVRDAIKPVVHCEPGVANHVLLVNAYLTAAAEDNERVKLASDVIKNAFEYRGRSVSRTNFVGDKRDWPLINKIVDHLVDKNVAVDDKFSEVTIAKETRQLFDAMVSSNMRLLINDNAIKLFKDSEVMSFIFQLFAANFDDYSQLVMLFDQKLLVKLTRSLLVALSLIKQDRKLTSIKLIAINTRLNKEELTDYKNYVKNYLITQSIEDLDINHEQLVDGDRFESRMNSKIFDLHKTCMMFVLFSCLLRNAVNVDRSVHKQSTFVQYNCARLNCLLRRFDQEREVEGMSVDYTLLTSEIEWKLISCITQFDAIVHELCSGEIFHFIQFLAKFSHLISEYYAKVKIFVTQLNDDCATLRNTRIMLVKALFSILTKSLFILGVRPVTQM